VRARLRIERNRSLRAGVQPGPGVPMKAISSSGSSFRDVDVGRDDAASSEQRNTPCLPNPACRRRADRLRADHRLAVLRVTVARGTSCRPAGVMALTLMPNSRAPRHRALMVSTAPLLALVQ